ncbi:sugar ABC transporter [Burkholderia thailandensis]|nr:sugar ABC transporter [Burkholderia thailandensis]PNE73164.1 sugar ABC transporter [Burkholderia thailandensis]
MIHADTLFAVVSVMFGGLAAACFSISVYASGRFSGETTDPNVAFYYAGNVPVSTLQAFDAVVVDPDVGFDPLVHPLSKTKWFARTQGDVSVNAFVSQRIGPLWRRGYRGFLLDTPNAIAAIERIREAYPDALLMAGGPDALRLSSSIVKGLYAVLGDSIVRKLDEGGNSLPVSAAAREQRLAAALMMKRQNHVPVVSQEFCERTDRQCARDTAAQLVAAGITPYVTDRARDVVGIGRIEVLPRKVLVVEDRNISEPLDLSAGVRMLATPLNYLGYDVEYADFSSPLPDNITPDRYAGVVAWIHGDVPDARAWHRWIARRVKDHVPVAFLGAFGFDPTSSIGSMLGLWPVPDKLTEPVVVEERDPMIGFEIMPKPTLRDLLPVRVGAEGRSLLKVSANGETLDQAAITPWGGYSIGLYTISTLGGIEQERWAIQPIAFLKEALRLPDFPSPSVTTENGRRLFMSHVDGDGFASRAEFPGPDFAGAALYERIWRRYPVPVTLSVIEGEMGPTGLHPDIAPRLEAIAKAMFALPNVEIGSHTYSHPFQWEKVDGKTGMVVDRGGDTTFSLNIPGYRFDLDREVTGTIDYINTRLAPSGKKVAVLQWPGDCMPPAIVVNRVAAAGVFNINGGDTVITKSANSWTNIAPIGIDKGAGAYQVFAPNQDENVYTNDWRGPFYGFARVLETYKMTDRPLRFKPIDVYYHMYSGTKLASLRALDQIFLAVLKQPVMPIYTSEYIRKVIDWRTFVVAREIGGPTSSSSGWLVRGNGDIGELHWPQNGIPKLDAASGVTGFSAGPDGTYIHIDAGSARFSFGETSTVPYIATANGFVRRFERVPGGLRFEFAGHYQPFVELANAGRCRISVDDRPIAVRHNGTLVFFNTRADIAPDMTYQRIEVDCGH